jgi:NAD(P)-dependent dehydrogenase (short-subunit alcohol dehydrogenase family)
MDNNHVLRSLGGNVKSLLKIFITTICLISLILIATGCAPRGETKSLDEILQIAKSRYETAIVKSKAPELVRGELVKLIKNFEAFVNDSNDQSSVRQAASAISGILDMMVSNAGYTTRPAMTEISRTYRGVAYPDQKDVLTTITENTTQAAVENPVALPGQATRKLLVARTFSMLAQELETTSFRVAPKGIS